MNITDSNIQVDHINGDTLDNRKKNLRFATNQQNAWNAKRKINNSTGYKGVRIHRIRKKDRNIIYRAGIFINGKDNFLGLFLDKKKAARIYNKAARKRKSNPMFSLG